MKKIEKIVLANRSLAENDPINLLRFKECQEYFETQGPARFIEIVENILDLNEWGPKASFFFIFLNRRWIQFNAYLIR